MTEPTYVSGAELDVQIARSLGWHISADGTVYAGTEETPVNVIEMSAHDIWATWSHLWICRKIRHYSSDLNAAFELLKPYNIIGWAVSPYHYWEGNRICVKYKCELLHEPSFRVESLERTAETPALAICAAYLAVINYVAEFENNNQEKD